MKSIDKRSIHSFVTATALSIGLGFVTHASAQFNEPHFYLIDLKAKTAIDFGKYAKAINNTGQVVGYSSDGYAFITGLNGVGMTDLDTLSGGNRIDVSGINNAGQVVGNSYTADGQRRAVITGPNGVGMTYLGTPPGRFSAHPTDINDAGQVTGTFISADGFSRAFITGPNGVGMRDLGTLGVGYFYDANGINNTGQVAGSFLMMADNTQHAYITGPNGVGMRDLGMRPGGTQTYAIDINNAGQVIGWSNTISGNGQPFSHAFITGPNGVGMTDLGTLGDEYSHSNTSRASGINNVGQVVGYSEGDFDGGFNLYHAFITGPDGVGMTDLNSLHLPFGFTMIKAIAINDMEQVLVTAVIPEPETYALMLAGLVLTGVMVRRKQNADAPKGILGS